MMKQSLVLFLSVLALSSCTQNIVPQEPQAAHRRKYSPKEMTADNIEYIALCECGFREGSSINFRSNGVQDKDGKYYVSVVVRPSRPGMNRLVVLNNQGEVIEYKKR